MQSIINLWRDNRAVVLWCILSSIVLGTLVVLNIGQERRITKIERDILVVNPCAPKNSNSNEPKDPKQCRQMARIIYNFSPSKDKISKREFNRRVERLIRNQSTKKIPSVRGGTSSQRGSTTSPDTPNSGNLPDAGSTPNPEPTSTPNQNGNPSSPPNPDISPVIPPINVPPLPRPPEINITTPPIPGVDISACVLSVRISCN